ncbi:hypothetical protein ACF09E_33560 [Streptomyces sp. NPDC014891]|uniref:hypothetical protein n=1 Tax=Streptomyces sp. NPDC014891 TaxID=3364929 RepID=UPI0037022763
MTRRGKHWRGGLGTPDMMVLFRTANEWRYALYFSDPGGVADGRLPHPGPGGTPDEAQTAARAKAQEIAGRPLTISWRPDTAPAWWTGTVTTTPPERPGPASTA